MGTRTCKNCSQTFPLDRKHFGSFKNDRNGVVTIGHKWTCKECDRQRARKHYQDKPEQSRARSELRRQRMSEAGPECSDADKAALKLRLGGRCRYCPTALDGTEELDHLTPVSRGGTNDIGNLTYACHACNRAKGSKTLPEYMQFRIERREPVRSDAPAGENPSPVMRANVRDPKRGD